MGDIETEAPRRPGMGAIQRFEPVTLQAVDVVVTMGGKQILSNISATFAPVQLCALMGPSGAGKTQLMMALAGRSAGTVGGQILVNGQAPDAAMYRRLLTIMPQDDIVHGALTVEQCLKFFALLRCPTKWTVAEKYAAVEGLIEKLGLTKNRSQVIGDELNPNLSGGQRKRVSAAMELLSHRPVLFMDEPTSGLDSATARAFIEHLAVVARSEGRTVISTIHQPSWAIMETFEQLVLLGKGGHLVFRGAPGAMTRHFAAGGSPCPASENPADHMLYVLAAPDASAVWSERWREKEAAEGLTVVALAPGDAGLTDDECPWIEQYRILFLRTVRVYRSDPSQMLLSTVLVFVTLLFLASQVAQASYTFALGNTVTFYVLVLYMLAVLQVVLVLPMERAVILREYRNGMYLTSAYWAARCSLAVLTSAYLAAIASGIFYTIVGFPDHPRGKPLKFFGASYLLCLTLSIFGMLLGTILPSAMISIKAVPTVMVIWLLGSTALPPQNRMAPALAWIKYPNPIHWALKIILVTTFDNGQGQAYKILTSGDYYGMHTGNQASCWLALCLCLIIVTGLGFAVTSFRLNKKDSAAGSRVSSPAAVDGADDDIKADAAVMISDTSNPLSEKLVGNGKKSAEATYGSTAHMDEVAPVSVSIRRLTFQRAGTTGMKHLEEVSCTFPTGSVTALMGPSGAGKTTLINVILGRSLGERSGDLHANQQPIDPVVFRQVSTLTPQDDNLLPDLTIRQTLAYTARLRCPGSLTRAEKRAKVETVIAELGLVEAADVVVGNALKPGVSGGQRKRCSIGMDLLSEKSVMFLDEPTTGLDANAAMTVMHMVRKLSAGSGRTLVVVLHQPQWSVLSQFDQLCLLAAGKNIYNGRPSSVADFFAAGGRPKAPSENPADHMMFALVEDGADKWAAQWVLQGAAYEPTAAVESRALPVDGGYPISQVEQYLVLLERAFYVFLVDEDQAIEYIMPNALMGLLIGGMYYNMPPNTWLAVGIFHAYMSLYLLSTVATVLNIPIEWPTIRREFRNGTYSAEAYWAARCSLCVISAFIVAAITTPIAWTMMALPSKNRLRATFVNCLCAAIYCVIGGLIGMVSRDPITAAQMTEPINSSVAMFGGVLIPKKHIKVYYKWLFDITPARYAIESVIALGFENQGNDAVEVMDFFKMYTKHTARNQRILLLMLIALVFLGFAVCRHRLNQI